MELTEVSDFNLDFDSPIGVFDSGVGGLTVLKRLKELCPNENYIYFGDTKNLPYGEKTKEQLIDIIKRIFDFFEKKKVKAVVMACNTSAAQVYDELKDKYSYRIYPIIQIASECIASDKGIERLGVFATNSTINSKAYSKSLNFFNPKIKTLEMACPEWVPLVENNLKNCDEDELILKYLNPILEFNPQKIILGCTHYPYLLDKLSKFAPKDMFINPANSFANYIKADLPSSSRNKRGCTEYYVSSNPDKFVENASVFLEIEKRPEPVSNL